MKPDQRKPCLHCQSRLLSLFCNLDKSAMEIFDQAKTTNKYKKGQIIFYEGNKVLGIFCIKSGKIKILKWGINGQPQIIRLAGPGDLLGYRSFLSEEPYHATAEALEDSEICFIEKSAFNTVLKNNQHLSAQLLKKLARELGFAENLTTSIAQKSAIERMAELLLILKESYGEPDVDGTKINLRLSREEMAEMIAVTQETAIRLLSEFRKEGIIRVVDRDITILKPQELLKIAKIDQ